MSSCSNTFSFGIQIHIILFFPVIVLLLMTKALSEPTNLFMTLTCFEPQFTSSQTADCMQTMPF